MTSNPSNHPETSMTLVTGATGAIGGALTTLLASSDLPFRVMCRSPQQLEAFRRRGIAAVHGDFADPASVRAAMEGCEQLVLVPPFTPALYAHSRQTIDTACDLDVRHIVKVSAADANPQSPLPWAAAHGRADRYLAKSGLAWTVLRPSAFMGGLLQLAPAIRRGVLPGTSGHGATTWIDSTDIAAAAERVLIDRGRQGGPGADGRNYLLTGTQPLSFPQVATMITERLDRRVRYLHIPAPALYLALRAKRVPHREAHGAVDQLARIVRRGLDDVRVYSTDLTDLIGRPALAMADYIDAHRSELT
ncbi:NAD(P)H-binding protein [Kineococcus rhizosphaerae]|uniref:Uncharacterized protein YbjT (DUF2867 family) n=1 Tax=Kineococcus rhizosphaerae TaxID=559628 RepID=A0A2T0QK54_9ACTN|nr:NAD(P)H-binding protein [Kineococcus rhizosphaerae]PRY04640.1 uncharacterized protein YbjT (DUF2867 family) [Kineococcus rhizosphaerae]